MINSKESDKGASTTRREFLKASTVAASSAVTGTLGLVADQNFVRIIRQNLFHPLCNFIQCLFPGNLFPFWVNAYPLFRVCSPQGFFQTVGIMVIHKSGCPLAAYAFTTHGAPRNAFYFDRYPIYPANTDTTPAIATTTGGVDPNIFPYFFLVC